MTPGAPLRDVLAVGAGGFAGSSLRYAVGLAAARAVPSLPLGTFVVNVAGCFAIGVLAVVLPEGRSRLFWITGVLGGFTTFSSFGYETLALWQSGRAGAAALNATGQLLLGLLAVAAGVAAARAAS